MALARHEGRKGFLWGAGDCAGAPAKGGVGRGWLRLARFEVTRPDRKKNETRVRWRISMALKIRWGCNMLIIISSSIIIVYWDDQQSR